MSRDPNQPRDFLDVYLAEMEKKENPNFDQEALELTCLDLFMVIFIKNIFEYFNQQVELKSVQSNVYFLGRGRDDINNVALVSFNTPPDQLVVDPPQRSNI